jgi:hypothetical protein
MSEYYAQATIHQFKTNLSRYIRGLESGAYRAVIVKRHKKPVAMFISFERLKNTRKDKV